jgi:hypothetical protein
MDSSTAGLDGDAGLEKKSSWEGEKLQAISEACKWRNLDQLRTLAESKGGFLSDELRQQACMSSFLTA